MLGVEGMRPVPLTLFEPVDPTMHLGAPATGTVAMQPSIHFCLSHFELGFLPFKAKGVLIDSLL